ncbi:MAG: outer membrane beta-barrel protein [Sulfuriferula sp.]
MKLISAKVAKVSGTLGLAALAVIGSPSAVADDAGWYVGANVGQSRAKIDDERISNNIIGAGFTSVTISDDDRDIGYKVFAGYQFNKYFALEGGYFDLGKFGYTATTVPAGTLNGTIKLQGLNLDAVGIWPITEKFSAFGRLGANYAEAKDSFVGTGAVIVTNPNPSKRDTNLKFGLGVQYAFNESMAMRVEAERYIINDAVGNHGDIDLLSLGLVYRFGAKKPAPEQVAVAPAPVPEVVTPAPVPEPVVVRRPVPKKVSFSADSLFDFDKATVKSAGKQELDQFAADLQGAKFEMITVTGHSDRIGTHAYNMKLSQQRADTVKAYLVESAGIPAEKITAVGVDGSEPVTKPSDCDNVKSGKTASKVLIDCLQPDRRVEVEVDATKGTK